MNLIDISRLKPISIHALREEGDCLPGQPTAAQGYFYPRPPRGGRRSEILTESVTFGISIHALREEGDHSACRYNVFTAVFLSTPSARRATAHLRASSSSSGNFYPRPPRGGRP